MAQSTISTVQIADLVTDHMDDLRFSGDLDDRVYQKKVGSVVRLLEEINQADIEVCGYLSIPSEAILFIKAGVTMSSLNVLNEQDYARIVSLASKQAQIDPVALGDIIDRKTWASLGRVNNGYATVYNEFPTGENRPSARVRIVDKGTFESDDGYFNSQYEPANPDLNLQTLAYIDEASRTIRLRNAFGSDVFLSLEACVIPSKIDAQDLDGLTNRTEILENYTILTPPYAKDLLVAKILQRVVPFTSKLQGMIAERIQQAQTAALDARPVVSITFRAEPNIGFY